MRPASALPAPDGTDAGASFQWPVVSETGETDDAAAFRPVQAAIAGRRNVSPRRLVEPGPSRRQLDDLLALAAAAPDHGQLLPWRFLLIAQAHRQRLGDAFVSALITRDPCASQEQMACAHEKAFRAPLLLVAISCHGKLETNIPESERLVSLGAAIQNLLIGARAMGFGSGLTSGQAMNAVALREMFRLRADESAVCFVNIGSVKQLKQSLRARPAISAFFSELN